MKSLDSKVLCVKYFNGIERSKGAEISCHRLYELYYIINAAQIEISKAEDKNLDISEWDCNGDECLENNMRVFIRGEHIKHAILNLNSVEDYVLQIVCAILDLHKVNNNSKNKRKHFEEEISKVKWLAFESKIKLKNENIYNLMCKYHEDTKKLRNTYANVIKHKHDFRWKGMSRAVGIDYSELSYIEPLEMDIDNVISYCKYINGTAVKYIEDIYNIVAEKYGLNKIN